MFIQKNILLKKCYLEDKHCEFRNSGKGGKRIGSGRGKSGWYKGYWCDSSWELAYVIYNIDHDVHNRVQS